MNWGAKAEVMEPEFLRDEIRKEAQVMPAHYSRDDVQVRESFQGWMNEGVDYQHPITGERVRKILKGVKSVAEPRLPEFGRLSLQTLSGVQ